MQIYGFSKFKSKKGNDTCLLHCLKPASERDNQWGHWGNVTQDLFVPDNMYNQIDGTVIGKEAFPSYELYNGKAYLSSLEIK